MGSIPKIVLTPLKWVSKKLIHKTLLRFPGGDPHDAIACTYCPEMCRFSCPTAVVSGSDAVTPCNKMSLLHKEERWPGKAAAGGPLWPVYDCTGCGRCTNYCVYGMPVADQLFSARTRFGWDVAKKAAQGLSDADDPVGDLADELGDAASATRRMGTFLKAQAVGSKQGAPLRVTEARTAFFLRQKGQNVELSWDAWMTATVSNEPQILSRLHEKLDGRNWLLHESSWLNRRLEGHERVGAWVTRLRDSGVSIELPYHHGRDCIDCGGEGSYSRLFL